jgi:glycosyltransferase involved in cell wall biosynthesis
MNNNLIIEEKPFVSVAICTQNRKEYLEKYSLPSVLGLEYPNFEVIIVNDKSEDGTEEFLKNYKDNLGRLRIVKNSEVRGIAHVRNLGVFHAQGEIIAFTDDDCIVDKNWLNELVSAYSGDDRLMAVGGFTYDGYTDRGYLSKDVIFGFNMSFKREVFDRFSFDINLFFHKARMHEETDLIKRMKFRGYKVGHADKAVVRHFSAPASYRRVHKRIGDHLNWLYMNVKKNSLAFYYYRFYKNSYQMFKVIKRLHIDGVLTYFEVLMEIIWVNCVLFF